MNDVLCPTEVADVQPSSCCAPAHQDLDRKKDRQGMGVRIGELVAIQDGVVPYVVFQDQQGSAAIRARAVTSLSTQDIGRAIVVSFVDGDLTQPVVIGCVRDDRTPPRSHATPEVEIDADGRTLLVTAKQEIVLRCGKASITLTRAGKVLIRGTYLVSRSSGVNCIKGGTVEIN